ncbi:FIG00443271: hypothetical protein [Olavius algarvensis associated proteobacterium Delta 3]|nr:FIG00443271: hypothetical protein [Olavius algarvensis associated proteobacterium Delta 3]
MTHPAYPDVVRYHEETKHHLERYARSPGYMDWGNQPVPFRFYEGVTPLPLPLLETDPGTTHDDLYQRENNAVWPINRQSIGGFLELSLAISTWKSAGGSRWALRINPSSGNLHPTEAHLVLPSMDDAAAGVFHYNPFLHALEPRASLESAVWDEVTRHFSGEAFLVVLTSIFWRESWKYGERAFRYCQHDTGHALAALSFSASLFGWHTRMLDEVSDDDLDTVLGFDKVQWHGIEREDPELICVVRPGGTRSCPHHLPRPFVTACRGMPVTGRPNRLSKETVTWDIIYETARLTRAPASEAASAAYGSRPFRSGAFSPSAPAAMIRGRRSAVSFDDSGSLSRENFLAILDKTLPRNNHPPFDAVRTAPTTHLLLFVHRVGGMEPGMYFFLRAAEDMTDLRAAADSDFLWQEVEPEFPLFLLKPGNFRQTAALVSCHQDIAGFSAFSLGMIVRFAESLRNAPWQYRRLFWETGMIGQVLYLEAEAHDVRGTGIGCFFDDAVHNLMGLADLSFQSLYHFTIGIPVEDPRLTSFLPYEHLLDRPS